MKQPHSREHLHDLVASCRVISEYAALADLTEVDDLLSHLLFVLTDGEYGHAGAGAGHGLGAGTQPNPRDAAEAIKSRIRTLGRSPDPEAR